MRRTHYEVLQVAEDASVEDIKRAYRRKARQYHPDTNGGDPLAEEAFKAVTEAWRTLSDTTLRRDYDHALEQPAHDTTPDTSVAAPAVDVDEELPAPSWGDEVPVDDAIPPSRRASAPLGDPAAPVIAETVPTGGRKLWVGLLALFLIHQVAAAFLGWASGRDVPAGVTSRVDYAITAATISLVLAACYAIAPAGLARPINRILIVAVTATSVLGVVDLVRGTVYLPLAIPLMITIALTIGRVARPAVARAWPAMRARFLKQPVTP